MASDTLQAQFTKLYDDESDAVFRFCLLRISDRETALDIMQDTFMRFWDTFSRDEKGVQNHRAFLFTIARNRIIDWYRKKKSLSLDSLTEKAGTEGELFKDTKPTHNIEMTYEAKALMEKIQAIDPLYQQAVYFRFIEGLEPKEIAAIIGQSVNVVSVRIHRGIRQLRKLAGYDAQEYGT